MKPAQCTRITVALSLVIGAVLTVLSIATMPDFSDGQVSRLDAIAATPLATLSAVTWLLSQVFVAVGVLGVAHLLRHRSPALAATSAGLVGLSCFGHIVYGGVSLVMLEMAQDPDGRQTHAAVLDRLESGVAIPFMAAGLVGLVLGFIVLSVALWRARLGPRWLGPALLLWLVVEFVGSALSEWSGPASALLFAGVFGVLALVVARSSLAHWQTAAEADERIPADLPVSV